MILDGYSGDMSYTLTFLGTRPAKEAWPKVLKAAKKHGFFQNRMATELGVSYLTLMRWFSRNPDFRQEFQKLKQEHYE